MSILHLIKALPDGRTVAFHVPTEFQLDITTNHMQIIVESYETEAAARSRSMASAKSVVDVSLPDWSPVYANNLINFVCSELEWINAEVLL